MKSVWYEMGMRNGEFRGVVPAAFMNSAYRFFLDLRDRCRQNINPAYTPPVHEQNFTFNGVDRFGYWRGWNNFDFYESFFTFQPSPHGTPLGIPIPEELWKTAEPDWEKVFFTEEEILGEKTIHHPSMASQRGEGPTAARYGNGTEWEKQRYRLILKMRYCLVPLQIYARRSYNDSTFYEYYGSRSGCINNSAFYWADYPQLYVKLPEYWTQEKTVYKIGIYAENLTSCSKVPLEGSRWISDKSFRTVREPAVNYWQSHSILRIYGAVDLSTHPDFKKYFHSDTN